MGCEQSSEKKSTSGIFSTRLLLVADKKIYIYNLDSRGFEKLKSGKEIKICDKRYDDWTFYTLNVEENTVHPVKRSSNPEHRIENYSNIFYGVKTWDSKWRQFFINGYHATFEYTRHFTSALEYYNRFENRDKNILPLMGGENFNESMTFKFEENNDIYFKYPLKENKVKNIIVLVSFVNRLKRLTICPKTKSITKTEIVETGIGLTYFTIRGNIYYQLNDGRVIILNYNSLLLFDFDRLSFEEIRLFHSDLYTSKLIELPLLEKEKNHCREILSTHFIQPIVQIIVNYLVNFV